MRNRALACLVMMLAFVTTVYGCGGGGGDGNVETAAGTTGGAGSTALTGPETAPSSVQPSTVEGEVPDIFSDPPTVATVGKEYVYTPQASGTPPLTWSLVIAPDGMSIDASTGQVTWTPTEDQLGDNSVRISVENDFGVDRQSYTIVVRAGNPPQITSTPPQSVVLGQLYVYEPTAEGDLPITWSLLTAPEGMRINGETGRITWSPTEEQLGTHDVSLEASNDNGSDTQDFQIEVVTPEPPQITSTPPGEAMEGEVYTYLAEATGRQPITWTLLTAPQGMTVERTEDGKGRVTWTPRPDQLGEHPVELEARNLDGSDSQSFSIVVSGRPVAITSDPVTQAFANEAYEYQVTAEGTPPITFSLGEGSPEEMRIDAETGLVTWIPSVDEMGDNEVEIVATNPIGTDTQRFTVNVSARAPQITSPDTADDAIVGFEWSYQGEAIGTPPLIWSLAGAPEGMTIESDTGLATWTPTSDQIGTHTFTIQVTNELGADARELTIDAFAAEPVITSTPPEEGFVGILYTYDAEATGAPEITWALDEAPVGMSVDSVTGVVTWTPRTEDIGTHDVILLATNDFATARQRFTVTVQAPSPPLFTSTPLTEAGVRETYAYEVVVTGATPITLELTTFPEGMELSPVTELTTGPQGEVRALVTWTPQEVGSAEVAITATNAFGTAVQEYTITVQGFAPVITSTPPTDALQNFPYTYTPEATGTPPLNWTLRQSPPDGGMTIDAETGTIDWTPPETGNFDVEIAVTNEFGEDTQAFTIRVDVPRPGITSTPPTEAYVGILYTYEPAAVGQPPLTWSLEEAPEGMTIDAESGRITWTPESGQIGTQGVTLAVENEFGRDTQSFEIEVFACEPAITTTPPTIASVGETYTYPAGAVGLSPISWRLSENPTGMTVDPESGIVTWTPEEAGEFSVVLVAENSCGSTEQRFTVTVFEPPVIVSTPLTAAVVGGMYRYQPEATGSLPLRWELDEGPVGMEIDPDSGFVTWTPGLLQTGAFDVTLRVSNIVGADTQSFTIDSIDAVVVSESASEVDLSSDCLAHNGFAEAIVTVTPKDDRGAYLPPDLDVSITKTGGGTFTTNVVNNGDGTYTRILQAADVAFAATIRVSVTANGVTTELPTADIRSEAPADPRGGIGGCPADGHVTVRVIDARNGAPFEEAFVMVGDALGDPFANNVTFTDDQGRALLIDPAISGRFNITVGAEGFVFFTINHVPSSDLVIPIEPIVRGLIPEQNVSGNVTGANLPQNPANLYAAFVIEKFDIDKLMTFDFNSALADFQDVVILGQETTFPGNAAIPPGQIYPELDYKIQIQYTPKVTDVLALAGSLSATQMLSLLNNAQTLSEFVAQILAIITPDKAGIRKNIDVTGDQVNQDVSLTHRLSGTLTVNERNHPRNLSSVAFSVMYDDDGKNFYPTGFTPVCDPATESDCPNANGTVSVVVTTVEATGVYSGLHYGAVVAASDFDGGSDKNSVIFRRGISRNSTQTFSDFFQPPSTMRVNGNTFTFVGVKNTQTTPPSPDPDIYQSKIDLIDVVTNPNTGSRELVFNTLWRILSAGGEERFTIPTLPSDEEAGGPVPSDLPSGESFVWELRGSALQENGDFDYGAFPFHTYNTQVTHAARNSVSFFR